MTSYNKELDRIKKYQKDGGEFDSPIEKQYYYIVKKFLPPTCSIISQYIIEPYRVDFLIKYNQLRLVVECDGKAFHTEPDQIHKDKERDEFLYKNGYVILRFTGSDIKNDKFGCLHKTMLEIEKYGPIIGPFSKPKEHKSKRRILQENKEKGKRIRKLRKEPEPIKKIVPYPVIKRNGKIYEIKKSDL